MIRRYCMGDTLPEIPSGKVGIIVGAHKKWTNAQIDALEAFCAAYGAVVFCDHAMPEELASLAVFMVSGAGDMIVGDTFYMTGGSGTITLHH